MSRLAFVVVDRNSGLVSSLIGANQMPSLGGDIVLIALIALHCGTFLL